VLLSNELLVLALSHGDNLQIFRQAVETTGYAQAHYLLILRDPVDQALSLYKHRAKSGKAPRIEEWPGRYFHYGTGLKNFLEQSAVCGLSLTCRKYSHQLEVTFFEEWLGLSADRLKKPVKRVNPSLSISELLLIREARQKDNILPELLYQAFLTLPGERKAPEPRIEEYYKAVLGNALLQYKDTWQACNRQLPADTHLCLPEQHTVAPEKVMSFSADQAEAIATVMKQLRSPAFLMKLTFQICKRRLGKWLNRVKPSLK
jgi:hypothetical protein